MNISVTPPVYSQIALDIAGRIARGELKEKERISGRSITSCEYGVSPETIRRSFRLLADMEIVEVHPNSGVVILSKEKAVKYIEKYDTGKDYRYLKNELKQLMNERERLSAQILGVIDRILDLSDKFRKTDLLHHFEVEIPPGSSIVGKTVGETSFWQSTGATIITIRRGNEVILSPGPFAVFQEHDVIAAVGAAGAYEKTMAYVEK